MTKKLVLIVIDGITPAAFEDAIETREAPTLANRPQLSVTYRPPDTAGDPILLAAGDIGD